MDIHVNISDLSRFAKELEQATLRGIEEAAAELADIAQDRLNTGYPPSSVPGESPHRRSGDGRRSVFSQALTGDTPEARTGTSSERLEEQGRGDFNYMAHWELHGRPWLLPSLDENVTRIGRAFERGFQDEA